MNQTTRSLVEQILVYSQDYPFNHLEIDNLMDTWERNKAPFIKKFGGTIKRSDVWLSLKLTEEEKDSKFDRLIGALDREVDTSCSAVDGTSLYDFLMDNKEGFFKNQVVCSYPKLNINKGMKLLKCFKYFLPSFTETRKAQDFASRFIQEDKIEGYLYLSVDPIDFLTLSENNSGWDSCHALDKDYRAGNLSYMLDKTTIVAYLANDKKENLRALPDGVEWYSKKWRMLLHTNNFESVIYYDRQYPFDSLTLEQKVANQIAILMDDSFRNPPNHNGFSVINIPGWEEPLALDHNFIIGNEDCIYDTMDIINEKDFLGYSDLIHSPFYAPITAIKRENQYLSLVSETNASNKSAWDKAFHEIYDIKIGEKVPCVKCGQEYITRTDSFLCDTCIANEDADEDFFLACETCGSRIYSLDEAVIIGGEIMCKTCADATNTERKGDI